MAPGPESFVCKHLEERQDKEKLVNCFLALQVGWPFSESFWKLFGRGLEGEDTLIHTVNLSYYIYPQEIAIPTDCWYDISV